ncbi:MAG: hypothetical protein JJU29_23170 [Verrucomicrobia bacterium]|nr:hypothetical protein [Verrucomicrobiota bacterium]MCH8511628.1 hypothetical protein [Kiritimatiellia bacterium]
MIKYIFPFFMLCSSCVMVPREKITFHGEIENITLFDSKGEEYQAFKITPANTFDHEKVQNALLPLPRRAGEFIVLVDSKGRAVRDLSDLSDQKGVYTGIINRRILVTDHHNKTLFYHHPSSAVKLSFRILNP